MATATVEKNGKAAEAPSVWARLREPFPPERIGKLPRSTKKDNPKGHCDECGGWHGLPAVHLDYVGHADVTDRLIDVDPQWTWEPLAFDEDGLPRFVEKDGQPVGLWIKLTVCGVTRLGYGSVEGGAFDAEKQLIGDALRNAALRFGVAIDLWKKSGENEAVGETGPVEVPGVDRDWREGDPCPECKKHGARGRFKTAKGGPRAGTLQCTGKIGDEWANHPAPPFSPAATPATEPRETVQPPVGTPAAAAATTRASTAAALTPEQMERKRITEAFSAAYNAYPKDLPTSRNGILADFDFGADPHQTVKQWMAQADNGRLVAATEVLRSAKAAAEGDVDVDAVPDFGPGTPNDPTEIPF